MCTKNHLRELYNKHNIKMSTLNIHNVVQGVCLKVKLLYEDDIPHWFDCIVTQVNGYGNDDEGTYVDVNIQYEDGEEVENDRFYEQRYNIDEIDGWHIVDNVTTEIVGHEVENTKPIVINNDKEKRNNGDDNSIDKDDNIPYEGNQSDKSIEEDDNIKYEETKSDDDDNSIDEDDNTPSEDDDIITPSLGAFERKFDEDIPVGLRTLVAICTGAFAGMLSVAAYSMYTQYIRCEA